MPAIPQTYADWEHCITVECGIPLTLDYVAERIQSLENADDFNTQRFIERWGSAHHAKTLTWFREAEAKLSS
ncbi:MAG: hypothetical protein AAGA87_01500 [Pseudomonadota bacterium]